MRVVLLVVPLLLVLGYVLVRETVATRVLGLIGALLIVVLLKVVFELFAKVTQLGLATSRSMSRLNESSNRMASELVEAVESLSGLKEDVSQTESVTGEIQQRTAMLESGLSDLAEQSLQARQRSHNRTEALREEIGRNVDDLTTKLDALIAAQQPIRRHLLTPKLPLRELTLQDSLGSLFPEEDTKPSS